MIKILILFTFLVKSSLACDVVSAPASINFAIDLKEKKSFFYNDTNLFFEKPQVSISQCRSLAMKKKYLMVSLGIENFVLSDEFLTYSLNDELSQVGEKCTLKDSLVKKFQSAQQRRDRLNKSRSFINKCLTYQVTDFSKAGIKYPKDQKNCKIERVSDNSVNYTGPFCYFEPSLDSSFVVSLDVNPNCLRQDYLKKNSLELQDVLSLISLYEAGDYSGRSPDLVNIKQVKLRASHNPLSEIIPINSDYESLRPVWPTTWNSTEIYYGEPLINTAATKVDSLKLPLVVTNMCEKKCKKGICTSSCNYSQPIVGDYSLYEVINGKKELVYAWSDGGIAPKDWQGMLYGTSTYIPKGILLPNRDYIIIGDFSDQHYNYMVLKGRIDKQIEFMYNHIRELNRGGRRLNRIQNIGRITRIEKLPVINSLEGINFGGTGFTGVQDALGSINHVFKSSYWPPFIEKTCYGKKCVTTSRNENKIALKFRLEEKGNSLIAKAPSFYRKSNLIGDLKVSTYKYPYVDCGQTQDDQDDDTDLDDFDF